MIWVHFQDPPRRFCPLNNAESTGELGYNRGEPTVTVRERTSGGAFYTGAALLQNAIPPENVLWNEVFS